MPLSLSSAKIVFFSAELENWKKDQVIRSDVQFYYGYLPSIFIFKDITLKYADDKENKSLEGTRIRYLETADGLRYMKMPVGTSIMMSPFFIMAHGASKLFGLPHNGYNVIYYFFIVFAAWFYAFLSLLVLRKTLTLLEIRDTIIALTLLVIFWGTNYFYYASVESGMSHIYSFFLFSVILYYTILWHQKPTFIRSVLLGAAIGLVVIVRPTNAIIGIVPLLYNVYSLESLKLKLSFIKEHLKFVILCFLFFGIISFIQPLVWKLGTGEWILYTYENEQLYLTNPKIIKGLFSYRKGLFLYTPIVLLAFVGMGFYWKKYKAILLPIIVFSVFNIYVVFSWWCWWYGGGYGMRSMIESYALLSIPMAILFQRFLNKNTFFPIVLIVFLAIKLNFFMLNQYMIGNISMDSMTKEAYWELLLNGKGENYNSLLEKPSYYSALQNKDERTPIDSLLFIKKNLTFSSNPYPPPFLEMNSVDLFIKWNYITQIEINADFFIEDSLFNEGDIAFVISSYNYEKEKNYFYGSFPIEPQQFKTRTWNTLLNRVRVDWTPDKDAVLKLYLWNKGGKNIKIKKLEAKRIIY